MTDTNILPRPKDRAPATVKQSTSARRGPGPRTQRRKELRRESRKRRSRYIFIFTAIISIVSGAVGYFGGKSEPPRSTGGSGAEKTSVQETWLLVGTDAADTSGDAAWVSLLSVNRKTSEGFMMYIPRTTYAEIPGHGLETLNKSLSLGKEPLLVATTANMLGIAFDHHLELSDQSIQALFEKVGTLSVDVPQRLTKTGPDSRSREVFAEGKQPMDGARVAEYLSFQSENGDEISRATRHASVWQAFFDRYRGHGAQISSLMRSSADLFVTDATAAQTAKFFERLASVSAAAMSFETLPVEATGVNSGTQLYKANRESIEEIVKTKLAGSRPSGAGKAGRRIEILNGNGQPGVGEEVSNLLIPKGFRVILDQNAKSFDYETTQIVVYSSSKATLAIAQEVRATLGVGEIIISKQQQSVVDVTVVVGMDYLKKKG